MRIIYMYTLYKPTNEQKNIIFLCIEIKNEDLYTLFDEEEEFDEYDTIKMKKIQLFLLEKVIFI